MDDEMNLWLLMVNGIWLSYQRVANQQDVNEFIRQRKTPIVELRDMARLVAKRYGQKERIDYRETLSPVSKGFFHNHYGYNITF